MHRTTEDVFAGIEDDAVTVGLHLQVLAVKPCGGIGHEQVGPVGPERAVHLLEVHRGAAFLSVGKGVGLEALHGQLVGQAERGLAGGEGAVVGSLRGGEVEPDGQRLSIGEVEVVARPDVVLLVIIHIVRLRLVGLAVKARPLAQHLCPVAAIGAVALQLIGHFAALELLGGYLRALRYSAGVEVVAVGNGGASERVRAEGVAPGAVVLADVETVSQGAGAVLVKYESTHSFLAFVRHGSDVAFDEAVGNGDLGIAVYIRNHARRIAYAAGMTARDVHIASAVGNVDGAIGVANQS